MTLARDLIEALLPSGPPRWDKRVVADLKRYAEDWGGRVIPPPSGPRFHRGVGGWLTRTYKFKDRESADEFASFAEGYDLYVTTDQGGSRVLVSL